MTLDNMMGITNGSYTGVDMFCKSQLITCNRVKECNGVCPFEDAFKRSDVDHDRDWIIGCIEHDGFICTHRFDKANQIIHEALQTELVRCKDCKYWKPWVCSEHNIHTHEDDFCSFGKRRE